MTRSPLADLEAYIFAAPFNIAPLKAQSLWESLAQNHPLVLVDEPGFWFRAYERHVEVSFASLETLWYASYCYTVLYTDRARAQAAADFMPLVLENPGARDAVDQYRWFLSRLHERRNNPWPSDAPTPSTANDGSLEQHATEFFLTALAWILHHEFGHLLLHRREVKTISEKDREWEADAHATQWLFEHEKNPIVRRKLFVGACVALGFLCARKPPTQDSDSHPPAFDRFAKMLESATPTDDEPAFAFAVNVLLTNWAVNGRDTWLQVSDQTFKQLFLAFGCALRHEHQAVWIRIDEQTALLYQRFVIGPIPKHDQRTLAYVLWEERNRPDGSPDVDWYHAEKLIRCAQWVIFLDKQRASGEPPD